MGSAQCPTSGENQANCMGAFMALHLTSSSSAYIEGLWAWLGKYLFRQKDGQESLFSLIGDHDLDGDNAQVTVFSGRGILSQSQGPVWLIGTG